MEFGKCSGIFPWACCKESRENIDVEGNDENGQGKRFFKEAIPFDYASKHVDLDALEAKQVSISLGRPSKFDLDLDELMQEKENAKDELMEEKENAKSSKVSELTALPKFGGSKQSGDSAERNQNSFQKRSSNLSAQSQHRIAETLRLAKEKARLRQLRLRVPSVVGGVTLTAAGLFFAVNRSFYPIAYILGVLSGVVGAYFGLLGLLPSDRRALPVFSICVFSPAVAGMVTLIFVDAFRIGRTLFNEEACAFSAGEAPCWHVGIVAASRISEIVHGLVVVARVVYSVIIKKKKKLPSAVLLAMLWKSTGRLFVHIGSFYFFKGVFALVLSIFGLPIVNVEYLAIGLPFLCVGLIILFGFELRNSIQSWFMSRGEAAVMAAGIAELLGNKSIDEVLLTARTTFASVSAEQIRELDMMDNHPNPKLASLTEKSHLGFVDVFVSHSWHDDPHLKWCALQDLRNHFKKKYFREPRLWIDKYSINQNDISMSLACLPVYLSGCSQLWILCGRTYLERLWCLIEIFVFLEMGGQRRNLRVTLLGEMAKEEIDDWSSDVSSRMFSFPKFGVAKFNSVNARVRSTVSLNNMIRDFDPRKARCFTEYDTIRLHDVIEIAGYERITKLVQDIFTRRHRDDG